MWKYLENVNKCYSKGKDDYFWWLQSWPLYNTQGPVQNENVGLLVQSLLRISRWHSRALNQGWSLLSVGPLKPALVTGEFSLQKKSNWTCRKLSRRRNQKASCSERSCGKQSSRSQDSQCCRNDPWRSLREVTMFQIKTETSEPMGFSDVYDKAGASGPDEPVAIPYQRLCFWCWMPGLLLKTSGGFCSKPELIGKHRPCSLPHWAVKPRLGSVWGAVCPLENSAAFFKCGANPNFGLVETHTHFT